MESAQGTRAPATMPAFRPLKSRTTVLMLGPSEWGKVVAVAVAGALLAFAVGNVTHMAEVPLTAAERASQLASLEDVRSDLKGIDARMAAAGAQRLNDVDLTASDRTSIAKAGELGIDASTTDEELRALVPATEAKEEPVMPTLQRWFMLFGLPVLVTAGLNVEYARGMTPVRELRRILRHARSQRVFASSPRGYLEEEGS